jgi:hypothetical protein
VNDAVADQIVVLAMIEHGQAHHARIFHGPPHELVVLHATAVIRDRNYPGLSERTDRGELFAGQPFGNRPRRQDIDAGHFSRAISDPGDRAGAVGDR